MKYDKVRQMLQIWTNVANSILIVLLSFAGIILISFFRLCESPLETYRFPVPLFFWCWYSISSIHGLADSALRSDYEDKTQVFKLTLMSLCCMYFDWFQIATIRFFASFENDMFLLHLRSSPFSLLQETTPRARPPSNRVGVKRQKYAPRGALQKIFQTYMPENRT